MFYKKENSGDWHQAEEVLLLLAFDREILNSENRKSIDGWKWHDEPPQEFLAWKIEQENMMELN